MTIIQRKCIELFWNDIYCKQCISCIDHIHSKTFCKKMFFTLCVTSKIGSSWTPFQIFLWYALVDLRRLTDWIILFDTLAHGLIFQFFNSTQLFDIESSLHSKFFVTKVHKKYIVNMMYHYKSKLLDILKLFENRML